MTYSEFIRAIAAKADFTIADTKELITVAVEELTDALKKGIDVKISDLGKFESKTRAAHTARNPQDGSQVQVPAKKSVKFKPSKVLKDAVNA